MVFKVNIDQNKVKHYLNNVTRKFKYAKLKKYWNIKNIILMNYYGLLIYVNLTCRFNHQKRKNHERIQRYLRQFQVWLVPTSYKPVQIVLSWSKITNYGFFPIMDCQSTMGHLDDRKSTWRTNSRPNSLYSCIQHLEYFFVTSFCSFKNFNIFKIS